MSFAARITALHASTRPPAAAPSVPDAAVELHDWIEHDEACSLNIGWDLKPWEWLAAKQRRAELDDQTERLAALLEAAGVETKLESDVVAISAVTGIVSELNAWRPIRFLPAVAARDRRPMLNALRYWLENEAPKPEYCRYGVFTSGDLVVAGGDLRGAIRDLNRRISKWASKARKRFGVEVHFRGTEFTRQTAAERGLDDRFPPETVLYHVHANVLLQPLSKMPETGRRSWTTFLTWTHDRIGSHWKDCGRVADVREIVKYVVKPGELLDGEKPLDVDEARWLHEALYRSNLAQPLGGFKAFWAEMAEDNTKVVRVRNRSGDGGHLCLVRKGRKLDHSAKADDFEDDASDEPGGRPANLCIGSTMPQWQHTPWAEPMLLVQNYQPGACGAAAIERLQELAYERMEARQRWDASGAPAPEIALQVAATWAEKGGSNVTPFRSGTDPRYSVHTCSLSVSVEDRDRQAEGAFQPPDPAPPDKAKHLRLVENFHEKSLEDVFGDSLQGSRA